MFKYNDEVLAEHRENGQWVKRLGRVLYHDKPNGSVAVQVWGSARRREYFASERITLATEEEK